MNSFFRPEMLSGVSRNARLDLFCCPALGKFHFVPSVLAFSDDL